MKNKLLALLMIGLFLLNACTKSYSNSGASGEAIIEAGGSETVNSSETGESARSEEPGKNDGPQIKEEWKDFTITDEQRKQFYNLVKDYRVDAMYEFAPGKPMELEWFKYYCAYFIEEEDKTYVDMGVQYSGKAIEKLAERFGTSYGLKEDDQVFVKASSLMNIPFAELIRYKETTVNGQKMITARCINYSFNEYMYNDRVESALTYPEHRSMVLAGSVTGYDSYSVLDFSFYTEDGQTPTQFVFFTEYPAWALEDGTSTLPDFNTI